MIKKKSEINKLVNLSFRSSYSKKIKSEKYVSSKVVVGNLLVLLMVRLSIQSSISSKLFDSTTD